MATMEPNTYLEFLKKALTRYPMSEKDRELLLAQNDIGNPMNHEIKRCLVPSAPGMNSELTSDLQTRAAGRDWPATAETMIGLFRLQNLQECIADILQRGVPGDLIETGVWRGGACIFMRAVLKAFGDAKRTVWLADSFQGLPRPDAKTYPADAGDMLWAARELAVSIETVRANFERYGLLDDQVRFLPGWFRDSLPAAPIGQPALLRLDGDMYESTMVALRSLYPKVSPGGYVIVDDYGAIASCRQAVTDFRAEFAIRNELRSIDWTGVFWRID
jgi:O-methyltransferase